jgi:hypothetical protein
MRSIRILLVVACVGTALAALAPAVLAAPNPTEIHLVKDCSTYTGEKPSLCTISESDMAALLVGTKVWYQGPVLTNTYFLSSNVLLDAGNGSTATGYCIFDARATESAGMCTFWEGTGALTGFTAILHVSIDGQGEWHMDGVYYLAGAASGHTPMWRTASPRPS